MNQQIKYIEYCKSYLRKKEYDKNWYKQNKEKVLPEHRESAKRYYQKVKGNKVWITKRKVYQREYRNRPEVKKRIIEYNQLLEVKERKKEQDKIWYEQNKEKVLPKHRESARIHYQKHKKEILIRRKEYYNNNPEIIAKRKARLERKKIEQRRYYQILQELEIINQRKKGIFKNKTFK